MRAIESRMMYQVYRAKLAKTRSFEREKKKTISLKIDVFFCFVFSSFFFQIYTPGSSRPKTPPLNPHYVFLSAGIRLPPPPAYRLRESHPGEDGDRGVHPTGELAVHRGVRPGWRRVFFRGADPPGLHPPRAEGAAHVRTPGETGKGETYQVYDIVRKKDYSYCNAWYCYFGNCARQPKTRPPQTNEPTSQPIRPTDRPTNQRQPTDQPSDRPTNQNKSISQLTNQSEPTNTIN